MTTKELIYAEIKRLIRDKNLCSTTERRVGGHTALLKLLAFLGTLPDEPVTDCHDLEEAADEYQLEAKKHILDGSPIGTAKDAFIAGAEWQKRKMMEGAVEGVVNHGTAVSYVISDEDQLDERLKQFQNDAKVRIIILPEDAE